jgi:NADPH2:quinone reductase
MKAISLTPEKNIFLTDIPTLDTPAPGYLWIKMSAIGINPGDAAFIGGRFAPGSLPESQYNVLGVSGAGQVLAIGEGVPETYRNKKVAIYRSLQFGDQIIGTWSEYAHLPYRDCLILPDEADEKAYSASLVNIITAYAFFKQTQAEGHQGIISTAGNSATGVDMIGICSFYKFPLISIVRNTSSKTELEALGAEHVLISTDPDFQGQLTRLSAELHATSVFDGVGGPLLSSMMGSFQAGTSINCYGFLGEPETFNLHTVALMRGISIQSFSNFRSKTVSDPDLLEQALKDLEKMIHMPHFKTIVGKEFSFDQIQQALNYKGKAGEKAVLLP